MSNEFPLNNDSLSDIKLRDFLYLDRARLLSYMAQIHDGLHLNRRLGNSATKGRFDSTLERTQEVVEKVSGEAGAAPFNVGLKGSHEKQTTKSFTTGGDWLVGLESSNFEEMKQDHDNLFLLFENFLNTTNRLTVLQNNQNVSTPFVQVTGALMIEDRDFIIDTFGLVEDIFSMNTLDKETIKNIKSSKPTLLAISKILKNLKLSGLHMQIQNKDIQVAAILNPIHLTVTYEQLRSIFMAYPIKVTVLGLILPKTTMPSLNHTSLFNQINLAEMLKPFAIDADYIIYPIAIYQTI